MTRLLCLLALCLAFASPCLAAENKTTKADPAYGVRYAQEQVVTLPQDQNKPYITVFGHPNDPRFREVVKWFQTNPTLVSLKNQTHFNAIHTTSAMFTERYAASTAPVLMVRMQVAGELEPIAELAGKAVPITADALAKHLNTKAGSATCLKRLLCKPDKTKPPEKDPEPQPLPPPTTPAKPNQRELPVWPCVVAVILAAIGGAGFGLYKSLSGKERM